MVKQYFYVYEWFNIDTNEVFYIGKGCKRRYLETKKRNKIFKKYLASHNCDVKILEYFDNEEEAFKKEYELIQLYKEKGQAIANLDDGGKGGCHFVWNDEMRQYMSEYNPMKDTQQKERFSQNNPMKNPDIAKKVGAKLKKKIWVKGKVYIGVKQTAEILGIAESTLRNWCLRGYDNENAPCYYIDESYSCLKQSELHTKLLPNKTHKVPVIIDNKYEFKSISEAASFLNISPGYLGNILKNHKQYKDHKCEYANQQPSQTNS